jgi:uncharacterized protein (DUF305 family)
VTAPHERRNGFNEADLRYLRRSLSAVKDVHRASDMATTSARDPQVRTLARRACATQADDIRAITSMLPGSVRHRSDTDQTVAVTGRGVPADVGRPQGLEIDRRFIEVLTAYGEASLASARTERVEGFSQACLRHAEAASRASWRQLTELSLLAPLTD